MINEAYDTYKSHAQYWDWSGHDRTAGDEYWYNYAKRYGNSVLSPMCAWGDTGAFMARRGMNVTAFDLTPEMIEAGKQRFDNLPGLKLLVGDATSFDFDIPPVDFCFSVDFEVLMTIDDIKSAFKCVNRHMRDGGGFVIEANLPPKVTNEWGPETYYPFAKVYPDRRVWKTGHGHNNAETGRRYISQTFHIEYDDDGRYESFDHSFYMQCYSCEEWTAAFNECGFSIAGIYKSREPENWKSGDSSFMLFEAVKTSAV